jgi:hypothetical protein
MYLGRRLNSPVLSGFFSETKGLDYLPPQSHECVLTIVVEEKRSEKRADRSQARHTRRSTGQSRNRCEEERRYAARRPPGVSDQWKT